MKHFHQFSVETSDKTIDGKCQQSNIAYGCKVLLPKITRDHPYYYVDSQKTFAKNKL